MNQKGSDKEEKAKERLEEKPKEETKPEEEPKPTEAQKSKEKPSEKPATCTKCGKKLSRKSWYYRNGRYYCNKRCWKSAKKEPK